MTARLPTSGFNGGGPPQVSLEERVAKIEAKMSILDRIEGGVGDLRIVFAELREDVRGLSESFSLFTSEEAARRAQQRGDVKAIRARLEHLENPMREGSGNWEMESKQAQLLAQQIAKTDALQAKTEQLERERKDSMFAKVRAADESRTHWFRFAVATFVGIAVTSIGWGIAWIVGHR